LDENKPLVPSYWVTLNGERVGLWFFSAFRLRILNESDFGGNLLLKSKKPGRHFSVRSLPEHVSFLDLSYLEPDPEDHLEIPSSSLKEFTGACPGSLWRDEGYWKQEVARLATTSAMYAAPLKRSFDWSWQGSLWSLTTCLYLWRRGNWRGAGTAWEKALRAIDDAIALPHWGNPREDGYAHNGDMGAANAMRTLAWAFHALHSELERSEWDGCF